VQSLHRAFSDSGVQIGLVTVEGEVAPENKVRNPKTIAEMAVEFWEKRDREKLEVNVREP
jgi:hypothetical protein